MKGIFVTGTDTGVGKTVVTGLLARYLAEKRRRVITQKWVQTGNEGFSADIDTHLRLMNRTRGDIGAWVPYMSLYNFRFAGSAHLAAVLEKRRIDADKIKAGFRRLSREFDFVIAEGLGGALVPLSRKKLVIDIAKELGLPVIIVAENRLGAVNHTLLTAEAVRMRGMKTLGIVFNTLSKKENDIVLKDNPRIIKTFTGERILGALPWLDDTELLYKAFMPVGRKVAALI